MHAASGSHHDDLPLPTKALTNGELPGGVDVAQYTKQAQAAPDRVAQMKAEWTKQED